MESGEGRGEDEGSEIWVMGDWQRVRGLSSFCSMGGRGAV